jgi:hypothetical protein
MRQTTPFGLGGVRSSRWLQRMVASGVPVWLVLSVALLPLLLLFLDLGTPSL